MSYTTNKNLYNILINPTIVEKATWITYVTGTIFTQGLSFNVFRNEYTCTTGRESVNMDKGRGDAKEKNH